MSVTASCRITPHRQVSWVRTFIEPFAFCSAAITWFYSATGHSNCNYVPLGHQLVLCKYFKNLLSINWKILKKCLQNKWIRRFPEAVFEIFYRLKFLSNFVSKDSYEILLTRAKSYYCFYGFTVLQGKIIVWNLKLPSKTAFLSSKMQIAV